MQQSKASYEKLIVWQRSIALTVRVYKLTSSFPDEEKYALKNQIQRAAVSIASNIAEGYGRNSTKEFSRFLLIANGSAAELATQLVVVKSIGLLSSDECDHVLTEINSIKAMIFSLVKKLKATS